MRDRGGLSRYGFVDVEPIDLSGKMGKYVRLRADPRPLSLGVAAIHATSEMPGAAAVASNPRLLRDKDSPHIRVIPPLKNNAIL